MLISAAISRGPPYRLLISWARQRRFELVVSHRLLYELEAVLLRPWFRRKLSYEEVLEYVLWLRERGTLAQEGEIERLTADPDDDYLIALAKASDADLVVSGDRHLLDLKGDTCRGWSARQSCCPPWTRGKTNAKSSPILFTPPKAMP